MKYREIRSFVLREGRMTSAQKQALQSLWPKYGIDFQEETIDFSFYFHREAPLVLEIGFGMGMSLLTMAQAAPEANFIGIEVHRPGVGNLLSQIEKESVNNLRVICHDAVEVLHKMILNQSLSQIQIFFPDPWHKKRHQKRRLIQKPFVEFLIEKLKPEGILHLATDWENYAEQMMTVLSGCPALQNLAGTENFADRPTSRPLTKFENRGLHLGHGVWDLLFIRQK
jgi:tRNA (guanine-N7-)-methyltransferase